ncbi:ABC transporter permease [Geodermatophilus aquaeductus]|uniref:Peptide/nickel transport system permease protein n=1 Tax=Geodermatophilus aquaeductus TaxID=1564161 RepID=A0A521DQ99_9ACTN|nr:ABC transporter permease [Geodermatophilus aquaeductus]SMO73745.1 peptide/nickel transport system permease protein [Geodermatophilus aquaeductus]
MGGSATGRYVLRRLAQAVVVLWAAYTVSFLVLDALPGDPVTAMASAGMDSGAVDQEQLDQLRAEYGYDDPMLVRYLDHLGSAATGDLGDSVATGRPVVDTIAQALPPTLQLAGAALALAVLLGGGLALVATYSRRRWLRQVLLSLPGLGVSVPTFWVGLVLVQVLSFQLRLFPAFGNSGPSSLVLPAVTLAIPTGALVAQVLAKSLLTALDEPYVQTARAKGAGRARVHLSHALRNASLPALTVVGLLAGQLLANSVVVETVFSRDGLGRVTAGAVGSQDLPLVQGVVVLGALVFVLVNLAVDLVYPLLDRRIVVAGGRRSLA